MKLDALLALAAEEASITEQEVADWRAVALAETGLDDVGAIRERQLWNPLASSTPIDQQITSSEQHFWSMWEKAEPQLKKILPLLFALSAKRMRIDDLKDARARRREPPVQAGNDLHAHYAEHCRTLASLGAGPSKIRQLKLEEEAIIADLARWKADDPRFEDAANPWLAIRSVYAGRTMEKVDRGKRAGKVSTPGAPPPDLNVPSALQYWRFGSTSDDDAPEPKTQATTLVPPAQELLEVAQPRQDSGERYRQIAEGVATERVHKFLHDVGVQAPLDDPDAVTRQIMRAFDRGTRSPRFLEMHREAQGGRIVEYLDTLRRSISTRFVDRLHSDAAFRQQLRDQKIDVPEPTPGGS